MELLCGHDLDHERLPVEEVAIHRLGDDARHLLVLKLHKRVVLRLASLARG